MYKNNLEKNNIFLVCVFVSGFIMQSVFAETYVKNYETGEVADNICIAYKSAPRDRIAVAGAGSAVPTSDIGNKPILEQIAFFTGSTLAEIKAANSTIFCNQISNQAKSISAIKAIAKKADDAITASCQSDLKCLQDRAKKGSIQRITDEILNDPDNPQAREIVKALLSVENPPDKDAEAAKKKAINKISQDCQNQMKKYGYIDGYCRNALANNAYPGEIIRQGLQAAQEKIDTEQAQLFDEDKRSNGLTATRVCLQTKSGVAPSGVQFYDPDCLSYRVAPLFLTQESVRQIVGLPYNQAFSAAGILGPDGGLANISTRVREGNLFDKDTTQNFGSQSGQTQGSPTGGGGTVLGNLNISGTAQELGNAEENYKKLIANVDLILNLYSAAKLAYSSSTSVCTQVPLVIKAATIDKIILAQKPFSDYKTVIKTSWDDAVKNPTKNHVGLINTINIDLRDKINQTLINSVLDAVRKLLQICTNLPPTS